MLTARAAFVEHERLLWGLSYRMLGSASDADDVVQDTFVRAIERPPRDLSAPLRPWLVRVAMNLSRDRLRRRRRQGYPGAWLPEPVPTERCGLDAPASARYEQLESATVAFLVAMEALTPQQRAVLILRDVMDLSVVETAGLLELSEANVKVVTHRARKVMAAYDAAPCRPNELTEEVLAILPRLVQSLGQRDTEALAALLSDDVRTTTDSGGRYAAARNDLRGSDRVARFFVGVQEKMQRYLRHFRMLVVSLNGLPTLVFEHPSRSPRWAPRSVVTVLPDADGRIRRHFSQMNDAKLAELTDAPRE